MSAYSFEPSILSEDLWVLVEIVSLLITFGDPVTADKHPSTGLHVGGKIPHCRVILELEFNDWNR